jgi:hypothetical protein
MLRALTLANQLSSDQRITPIEYLFNNPSKTPEQFVDEAFRTSRLPGEGMFFT